MRHLSRREASIVACLADTLLAPGPPLPPVEQTDAVEAFDAMLARAPSVNRAALRGVLIALELAPRLGRRRRPWRRLCPADRLAFVTRIQALPVRGARQAVEALRSAVALAYYGDPGVQRLLGYDPARRAPA